MAAEPSPLGRDFPLNLESREAFETALEGYDGAILAVSHDRRFTERFADVVAEL